MLVLNWSEVLDSVHIHGTNYRSSTLRSGPSKYAPTKYTLMGLEKVDNYFYLTCFDFNDLKS